MSKWGDMSELDEPARLRKRVEALEAAVEEAGAGLPDLEQRDHDWIAEEALRLFRNNEYRRGVQRPAKAIPLEYLDYWIAAATWRRAQAVLEETAWYSARAALEARDDR